jgi:hypothetical protein
VDKDGDAEHVRNSFPIELSGRETVRPDTTALIAHRVRGYYRPISFEIERTHKNLERTRQRFRIYDHLLASQHAAAGRVFKREMGKVPEKGMAVFVAAHRRHAETLRQVPRNTLGLDQRGKARTPEMWFTSLEEFFGGPRRSGSDHPAGGVIRAASGGEPDRSARAADRLTV